MYVAYAAGWCITFRHGHRIFIKHSSFTHFSHLVRITHVDVTNHVTSLGDLELGDFAGLDSGLDS